MPALLEALEDPQTRSQVAGSLGALGSAGKPAVPALLKLFNDPHSTGRNSALRSLVEIDPEGENTIVALIAGLADKDSNVSEAALDGVGPKTKAAVPALVEVLKDEKATQSRQFLAASALESIGPEAKAAVPTLVEVLKNEKATQSQLVSAINVLRSIGPEAKAAVPALLETLKRKDAFVRRTAERALQKIDPGAAKKPRLR
jgi:HEAT repeat protein